MRSNLEGLLRGIFLGILVSLVLGQLQRVQLTPTVAVYIHDILLVLFSSISFTYFLVYKKKLLIHKTFQVLIVFIFWSGLTLLISAFNHSSLNNFVALLYWLRFINFVGFLVFLYNLYAAKILTTDLTKIIISTCLAFSFLGVLQYIFWPDTRILYTLGWDDHLNRLIGTYFDPGFTGLLLTLGFVFSLSYKKYSLFTSPLLVTALLTYSRATFLTILVVLCLWILQTRKLVKGLLWLFVVAVLILLLPRTEGEGVKLGRTQSITSRVSSTISAAEVFKEKPFFGAGFNHYRSLASNSESTISNHSGSPDNSYLFVAATTGLVGLCLFGLWLVNMLYFGWKNSLEVLLSMVAISVHSMFNNSWFYPFVWILFALILSNALVNKKQITR